MKQIIPENTMCLWAIYIFLFGTDSDQNGMLEEIPMSGTDSYRWLSHLGVRALGCSDFDFFFTFWGITTHPWHHKGPRIWKVAKKNFKLHWWPAEIFGQNRKMCFFGMISKFNIRSPVWQIFTIFSVSFIYGILNTHTKF